MSLPTKKVTDLLAGIVLTNKGNRAIDVSTTGIDMVNDKGYSYIN